jgi:predicted acyltransferase
MFMVGVSFTYSYAKRKKMGHSNLRMFGHTLWRSLILVVLGILLISNTRTSTNWSLVNVLTQIGLGYSFLFLMWRRSVLAQFAVATVVLAAVWAGYYYYPQIRDHDPADVMVAQLDRGVSDEWAQRHLVAVDRPWHKNANLGHQVDEWLLNQLPRQQEFEYQRGGYPTINFIPSFVTMLFGLMSGELLRSNRSCGFKLVLLILAGAAGLSAGWIIDATGLCPLVKRIWTPSWTLFSGGWCCLILAAVYFLFDILPLRFLALPFVVVGVNSMAIYCMSMLLKPWVAQTFERHFGEQVFRLRSRWGDDLYRLWFVDDTLEQTIILYQPTIQAVMIGLVFWLTCCWMYRQRIFLRI